MTARVRYNDLVISLLLMSSLDVPREGMVELMVRGQKIEVFTYRPKSYTGKRMIMVLHGTLRNASEYRDDAREMGDRFGALIVAPLFELERFPSLKYQRGGILNEDGTAAPAEDWTYHYIPEIAAKLAPKVPFWIIGHSAGGQFVMRMSGFLRTGAQRLVAANPGSDLFPTRSMPFGYGFGGLPESLSNDEVLEAYLAQPLMLYLGTADNGPDEYLDVSAEANAQGVGRVQRGRACFAYAKDLALARGWTFGWTLVEARMIEHDHTKMFNHPACERALFGSYNSLE